MTPLTEAIKALDFIGALKKKQEVWYEIMAISAPLSWWVNSFRRPSSFRPSFSSQSKAFLHHQAQ